MRHVARADQADALQHAADDQDPGEQKDDGDRGDERVDQRQHARHDEQHALDQIPERITLHRLTHRFAQRRRGGIQRNSHVSGPPLGWRPNQLRPRSQHTPKTSGWGLRECAKDRAKMRAISVNLRATRATSAPRRGDPQGHRPAHPVSLPRLYGQLPRPGECRLRRAAHEQGPRLLADRSTASAPASSSSAISPSRSRAISRCSASARASGSRAS